MILISEAVGYRLRRHPTPETFPLFGLRSKQGSGRWFTILLGGAAIFI